MRRVLFPVLVAAGALALGCGRSPASASPSKFLVGEFEGHPSLKKRVDQGYQVIVL
ncbi:MAG: hypothetical protein HY924_11305 [Elusimicrobia bacterium]|nr:hypothetical protein [Elusimicrobiota bacterium]